MIILSGCSAQPSGTPPPDYLAGARAAADWLSATAVQSDDGVVWPVAPDSAEEPYRDRVSDDLYSGGAGVVLFLLEMARLTGESRYRELATRGADHLLASLPDRVEGSAAGLYSGIAGRGFVLHRAAVRTGEQRFLEGSRLAVDLLEAGAVSSGTGVEWGPVTDIVSGSAGTGLFLLYAGRHLEHPPALDLAEKAGRRLLELSVPTPHGLRWRMSPDSERDMPNFSHGTAGIAYFLASLALETGNGDFEKAAVEGARHLLAIADVSEASCRIHHHSPGGEQLYYLSWCHGPAGTARLFYRLFELTGDAEWLDWLRRSSAALEGAGLPEQRTEGYWNNVGPCCGSAGVASFLLDVDRVLGENSRRQLAVAITNDLMARADAGAGGGLKWVQAEHRVRPGLLAAQTGYMQGAAGIGLWLLELEAQLNDRPKPVVLPDSPF